MQSFKYLRKKLFVISLVKSIENWKNLKLLQVKLEFFSMF